MKTKSLEGRRIRLILMRDEDMQSGTLGTIQFVDSLGTIHVTWDNGRSLGVVPDFDQYEILGESP